jgi:hypothetical protein
VKPRAIFAENFSMTKRSLFYIFLTFVQSVVSQVGIGTNTPDNTSMLEVQSNSKGFLLPRMSSAQRMSIPSPASGLQVYDNNTNSLWYYNGTHWVNTITVASFGDVKSGIQTFDHSGWILLDGRAINTLTATQQAAAAALGLVGNIPNATNSYLVQNGGVMGAVSGSNTVTLTQGNLPNVNFTGNTSNAGTHSHTTDPAAFNSANAGSHNHTTDPASVNTSTNGWHDHGFTDYYYAENQGFSWGWAGNNGNFDWDNAGYSYYHNTDGNGNHTHTVDIPSTASSTAPDHNHSIDVPSTTSSTAPDHSHTVSVSSGGSATPVNIAPQSLTVNMFIYLGH